MCSKDTDGMANSEDPEQIAKELSDLGLHCLIRPVLKFGIIMAYGKKAQNSLQMHIVLLVPLMFE